MYAKQYILTIITTTVTNILSAQPSATDTVFIKKDKQLGTAQSIYIDHNKNAALYAELTQFSIDSYQMETFVQSKEYLKKNKLTLEKKDHILPYHQWIEIKQFKQNWYAYYPCNFYTAFKQSINDSSFIDWTGEGPILNKIIHQKKLDSSTYELKLAGVHNKNRILTIQIIDTAKGIAVFKEFDNRAITQYYVMIAANKLNMLPMIVNNCKVRKQEELEFEEPDYKKLMAEK